MQGTWRIRVNPISTQDGATKWQWDVVWESGDELLEQSGANGVEDTQAQADQQAREAMANLEQTQPGGPPATP